MRVIKPNEMFKLKKKKKKKKTEIKVKKLKIGKFVKKKPCLI